MRFTSGSVQVVAVTRLVIGVAQGAALYVLARAFQSKTWPATDLALYDAMIVVARFLPVFAIVSVGNLRTGTAALWLTVIAIVCAGLGYYEGFRDPTPQPSFAFAWTAWLNAGFGVSLLLFIGHSLVAAADIDRRKIASFPTYFDVTWRLGTQFALATLFVSLFWGILWLGAFLFQAIGIDFFMKTILKVWFSIPSTAMATSVALHLTDARAGLVRGARSLFLNLLCWLMPMMTLIGFGFLVALPFTGLEPLWKTHHATGSLLSATAILILLINSHFQDGGPEADKGRFLTYTRLLAALIPTPLLALAAYGLWLRIGQYGWSPSRVIACAILVVGACHALGYAFAASSSGIGLRALPATNIASAFVMIVGLLAVLTPVADPARVAVASQVGRLEAGAITPDKFDYGFLRLRSARFGREALERLKGKKEGPNAAEIASRASLALANLSPTASVIAAAAQPAATRATRAANISVTGPTPGMLPENFLAQDWNISKDKARLPPCLTQAAQKCDAVLVDLTGDGEPETILMNGVSAWVFHKDTAGTWVLAGTLGNVFCNGVRDALRTGKFTTAPAIFKADIEVNGMRLPIVSGCPPVQR